MTNNFISKNSGIYKFKLFVKKMVSVFASREFAFLYAILGSLSLIAHSYFLISSVSSFTGVFKIIQAAVLSIFISTSLLYFVSIADKDEDEKEYKRIMRAVNLFMYMEIAMNLYYYCRHLIIDAPKMRIFDFVFGALISVLIPVTIKLYANSIKAKQWLTELEEYEKNSQPNIVQKESLEFENIDEKINQKITEKINNLVLSNTESFENMVLNEIMSTSDLTKKIIDKYIENGTEGDISISDMITKIVEERIDAKLNDDFQNQKFERIDLEDIDNFYHKTIENKLDEICKNISENYSPKIQYDLKLNDVDKKQLSDEITEIITNKFINEIDPKIEASVKNITKQLNIR